MSETIYLLGFMGTGKSVVGQQLAEKLDYQFIDLDDYIAQKENHSIHEIFIQKGETYFRKKEHLYLKEVASIKNAIISLGGGTPCREKNWKIIKKHKSIYLKTSRRKLTERLFAERSTRPLISAIKTKTALRMFIGDLLNKRKVFYERADHIVWNRETIRTTVDKILKII